MLGQFLLDPFRLGLGLVNLVDRHDDRHSGSLGVVDGFAGLGHDAIVGGDHQDNDIGNLGTAGTHGGKSLVTRRIEEGNLAAVQFNVVGADMLGNAARLAGDDIGFSNGVQKRCLAMIDMAHDGDHRRPFTQCFRRIGG